MKILSHRGYWKSVLEKNTLEAFQRSFSIGLGTETDIRDFNQNLVISHDMPTGNELDFNQFLQMASLNSSDIPLTLALNIKADGLAIPIRRTLDAYPNLDCFVFDMSVPDMRSYFAAGVPVFTRMSEVERNPAWLDISSGVWLDGFASEWYGLSVIRDLLTQKKRVCIVSPEIHGRNHRTFWQTIKTLVDEKQILICTDYPEEATDFFNLNKGM